LAPSEALALPSADTAKGVDRLGIADDVRTLASVIAARGVSPPLSVGLFADWGGGKSFFMGQLKSEVSKLAVDGDPAFCSGIRSIEFNAWHYRDADLWSSIVSHIFEQLSEDPTIEPRVAKISALAADAALQTARRRRERVQRRVVELEVDPWSTYGEGSSELRTAAFEYGIPSETLERLESRTIGFRYLVGIPTIALRELRRNRRALGIFLAVLIAAVIAGAVIAWAWESIRVLLAVPALAFFVMWLGRAVEAGKSLGPALDRAANARNQELEGLAQDLKEIDTRIEELQMQLDVADSSQQLLAFIKSRSDSPAYRERLGVINLIRRDFEAMSKMLADSGAASYTTGPRIDRIVLYIDDLDRCPSERVVEVLEAIHLILAIPLFVVVVAVDPRWLIKSLELHHSDLLSSVIEDGDPAAESHWTATPINYLEKIIQIPFTLRAMTDAGFADLIGSLIPTVSSAGVDSLKSGDADRPTEETQVQSSIEGDSGSTESGVESVDLENASPVAQGPVPIAFRREHHPVEVTDEELRFLQLLRPLLDTPRATKKMANTYRLVRTSASGSRLENFVGKVSMPAEHRAASILLAVVIGRPLRSLRLFEAVAEANGDELWLDFLETLRPVKVAVEEKNSEGSRRIVGDPSTSEDQAQTRANEDMWTNRMGSLNVRERDAWEALASDLVEITTSAEKQGIDVPNTLVSFQNWLYETARFSFQTGRLVSQRPSTST